MKKHSAWFKGSLHGKKERGVAITTPFYSIIKNGNDGIYVHNYNGENIMLVFTNKEKAEEFRLTIHGKMGFQNDDGTVTERYVTPSNFYTLGFKTEAQFVYVVETVYKNGGVVRIDGIEGDLLKLLDVDSKAGN